MLAQILFLVVLVFARFRQQSAQDWAIHSQEVMVLAERCNVLVRQTQAQMQSFILTGQERFEQIYNATRNEMPVAFQMLREHVSDNRLQQAKAEELWTRTKLSRLGWTKPFN